MSTITAARRRHGLGELDVVGVEGAPGTVAEPDRTQQPAPGPQREDRKGVDAHVVQGTMAVTVGEQRPQRLPGLRPTDDGAACPEGLVHLPHLFGITGDPVEQPAQGRHLGGINVRGADDGLRVGRRLDQPDDAPVGDPRDGESRQLGERRVQPQGARERTAQLIEEPQPLLVPFRSHRQAGPIERQRTMRGDVLEQLGVAVPQPAFVLEADAQDPERLPLGVAQRNHAEGVGVERLGRVELRVATPALRGARDRHRPAGPHHLGGGQRRTARDAAEPGQQDVLGDARGARDDQLVFVGQHIHHAGDPPQQGNALVEHRPHDLVGMAQPVEPFDEPGCPRRGTDGAGGVDQHARGPRDALCPTDRLDPEHRPAVAGAQPQRFLAGLVPGLAGENCPHRVGGGGAIVGMEQLQPPVCQERRLVGLRAGRAAESCLPALAGPIPREQYGQRP